MVEQLLVDLDLRRRESRSGHELELGIADQFSRQPEERLLEVIVGLGRNVVVLEVLLAVECDGLSLDFALLDIDLVSAENDRDVFADTDEITCFLWLACWNSRMLAPIERTMPVGDILVCDSRRNIEHDDTALAVDVVAISQTAKLLLTCGVPDVELDLAQVLL